MKNLPEKIYFNKRAAKRSIEFCSIQNIRNGSDNMDVVEYIRSDIAKEFASFYLHETFGPSLNGVDELFTEFLTNRKNENN